MDDPARRFALTGPAVPLLPEGLDATLVLVRHGESVLITEERFQGQMETPLSTTGLRQAALVARRLARNFPHPPPLKGADVAFASHPPPAAGMSSSSASSTRLTRSLAILTGGLSTTGNPASGYRRDPSGPASRCMRRSGSRRKSWRPAVRWSTNYLVGSHAASAGAKAASAVREKGSE